MNNQEMFDTVVTHLLTQKVRSEGPTPEAAKLRGLMFNDNSCLYRGPGGLKCAAGCLIPDDKYSESMEALAVDGLPFFNELCTTISQMMLLKKLQRIHDNDEPSNWEGYLRELANANNLQFNWKAPC